MISLSWLLMQNILILGYLPKEGIFNSLVEVLPKRRYFSTEIRETFSKPYIKVYFMDDSIATDAKMVVERLNVVRAVNITPSSSKDYSGNTLTVYPKSMVDV